MGRLTMRTRPVCLEGRARRARQRASGVPHRWRIVSLKSLRLTAPLSVARELPSGALLSGAGVIAFGVFLVCCGSTRAAPQAALHIGFVRGDSVFVASSAGTGIRQVLRAPRSPRSDPYDYSYSDPAWSRSGSLAVTETQSPKVGGHNYASVLVVRPRRRRVYLPGCGANEDDEPSWAPDGANSGIPRGGARGSLRGAGRGP